MLGVLSGQRPSADEDVAHGMTRFLSKSTKTLRKLRESSAIRRRAAWVSVLVIGGRFGAPILVKLAARDSGCL